MLIERIQLSTVIIIQTYFSNRVDLKVILLYSKYYLDIMNLDATTKIKNCMQSIDERRWLNEKGYPRFS